MINKKIFSTILFVAAVTSCSTVNKNEKEKVNPVLTYKNSLFDLNKEVDNINNEKKNGRDPLNYIDSKNFNVSGLDYLYENEEIYTDLKVTSEVTAVKMYSKKPEFIYSENSEQYEKYTESVQGKYTVQDILGSELYPNDASVATKKYRKVTLETPYVYVLIRDNKTGKTKELLLDKPITIKERETKLSSDNLTINNVKNLSDSRLEYKVNSIDSSNLYTLNELPKDFDKTKEDYDWFNNFSKEKYYDEDDLAGVKRVTINETLKGGENRSFNLTVNFGEKIQDYKNEYETILSDLSKVPLKFSKDGTKVEGGFDDYYTEKLLRYHSNTPNSGKLEFVTEILDDEKQTVGKHNIVRKILLDGREIYKKYDSAFINFPGVTAIVADGNFFDLSDTVENRTYRITPKSEDIVEDFVGDAKYESSRRKALQGLERTHGASVIGSMIDEIAAGDGFYWSFNELDYLMGKAATNTLPSWAGTRKQFNQVLPTYVLQLSKPYEKTELYIKHMQPLLVKVLQEINDVTILVNTKNTPEEKIKEAYKKLHETLKDYYAISEDNKLKFTNLNFATITSGNGGGSISPAITGKNLSAYLDLNPTGAKVINMSYGNDYNVDEYIKLKNMTEEEKEKAAKFYNENPGFRFAVEAWLKNLKTREEDWMKEHANLSIPSVYSFFATKDTITKEDYQKLIDLKLLTLEQVLKSAPEFSAANHDILFVRSEGNTLANGAEVDLTDFDENGVKKIYKNPDYKYNNGFTSVPTYLNLKEKAEQEGKEYKYNYSYRKNLLGSVGLATTQLIYGAYATETISDKWGLYTDTFNMLRLKAYGVGMLEEYNYLLEELNNILKHPENYTEEYKKEIEEKIAYVDKLGEGHDELIDKSSKFSFSRAGQAMLWSMAAEGGYVYSKDLTEEEQKYNKAGEESKKGIDDFIFGSSFSAPRMTAVAAVVGGKFPFMSAHDIKTTLLTTALDDYRIVKDQRQGLYGVDENIGWGILDKTAAYKGPARFVKALTHEVGQENFVADIPNGYYEFSNDIKGAFDSSLHMLTRNKLTDKEYQAYTLTKQFTDKDINNSNFLTQNADVKSKLNELGINIENLKDIRNRVSNYKNTLSFEESELFESAGLEKKGNGTLVLSGDNTYTEPTLVNGGTLVIQGSNLSDVIVSKDAKLKLDSIYIEKLNELRKSQNLPEVVGGIKGNVVNEGKLYSYSNVDKILGTYTPSKDSKTNISVISLLTLNRLDLSNTNYFSVDVFRKPGMNVFKIGETLTENNDSNRKLILDVKNISEKDLGKVKLGIQDLSASLVLNTVEVKNEDGTKGLKVYIERKNKIDADLRDKEAENKEIEKEKEKTKTDKKKEIDKQIADAAKNSTTTPSTGTSTGTGTSSGTTGSGSSTGSGTSTGGTTTKPKPGSSESPFSVTNLLDGVREAIYTKVFDSEFDSTVLAEANEDLNLVDFLTEQEAEKLNGDILADSILLGFDIANLRNRNLTNVLKSENNKKYGLFANQIVDLRVRKTNDKNVLTTITQTSFGASISSDINTFLIAFDYTNSRLKDVKMKVKVDKFLPSEKEGLNSVAVGDVIANGYNLSFANEFRYKGFTFDTILSGNYINKVMSRELLDKKATETSTNDFVLNLYNEAQYKYSHKLNDDLDINVAPYIGLDLTSYIKGEYAENNDFGYNSKSEAFTKVNTKLGVKLGLNIKDKLYLEMMGDYTKYLTNTDLDSEIELNKYKFTRTVQGVKLKDHSINVGLNMIYSMNDNLSFNLKYNNKDLYTNTINLGIKFEF